MGAFQKMGISVGLVAMHVCAFAAPVTQTFAYTGAGQTFLVPPLVTSVTLEAWGAQGGTNNPAFAANQGGYATGSLSVTPGETLQVYVGGQPSGAAAGFNGGGLGESGGAGGGGASDIRQGGAALANRVLVAAGGGGGGIWSSLAVVGGVGGGATGGDGYRNTLADMGGLGATQTAGGANGTCVSFNVITLAGSLGQGGSPAGLGCGCEGYGGGGGYYGGAGSGNCRGGGGGSSYIGSVASGITTSGARLGHGEIRITYDISLPQTLTFAAPPAVVVGGTGSVSASSALPNSGNAITYASTSVDCSVSAAGIVTGIHAGTNNCTVTAIQPSGGVYAEGTASLTFSISQASQSLTFPPQIPARHVYGPGTSFAINPQASSAGPNSGNAVVYSSLSPGVCTVSATTVTMLAAGVCTLAADQAGNLDFAPAPQVSQAVELFTVAAVPTLSGWGLTLLALGAAGLGARRLRRRDR